MRFGPPVHSSGRAGMRLDVGPHWRGPPVSHSVRPREHRIAIRFVVP